MAKQGRIDISSKKKVIKKYSTKDFTCGIDRDANPLLVISGETGQSFEATMNGNYAV